MLIMIKHSPALANAFNNGSLFITTETLAAVNPVTSTRLRDTRRVGLYLTFPQNSRLNSQYFHRHDHNNVCFSPISFLVTWNIIQWFIVFSRKFMDCPWRQESRAIAKMTARRALYMDALKNFRSPCMATPTATFPEIVNGFCCNRSYESAYKIWSS